MQVQASRTNDRRAFMARILAASTLLVTTDTSNANTPADVPRPNPQLFQAGDFVWPKKPQAYVPYNAGTSNSAAEDRALWRAERDAFLLKHAGAPTADPLDRQRIQVLQGMDYREFIAVYAGGQALGQPGVYSGGAFYVGHVGIIDIDPAGTPWVIEALMTKGVVRVRYRDWIEERFDSAIWLGRLKAFSSSARNDVVEFSRKQVGKPYNFWNFDLNDDTDFYCSKLAWLCCHRVLKISIDENPQSKRILWFSPKQMLNAKTSIEIIHNPGSYAY